MEHPGEGEQPPPRPQPQPWGRLLRLGAEEGEPYVLLRKPEWTIGRRRGEVRCGAGTGTAQAGDWRRELGSWGPWEAPGRGALSHPVFPVEWVLPEGAVYSLVGAPSHFRVLQADC